MLKCRPRRLKHGGYLLDRVISRFARNKRALHSDFWSHGAADIDLPAWWVFSLQNPPGKITALSPMTLKHDDVHRANHLGGNPFLESLYPPKTWNHMRNFVPYQHSVPAASLSRVPKCNTVRTYASRPSDEQTTNTTDDDSIEFAEELGIDNKLELIEEHDVDEKLDDAIILSEDQENTTTKENQEFFESEDGSYDAESLAFDQNSLSIAEEEYTKALKHWESLDQGVLERTFQVHETKAATRTLFQKADALQVEYNLKTRELFDQIPVQERLAHHYHQAILCAIDEKDFARALEFHQEAISQGRGNILESEIVCKAVVHNEWSTASTVCKNVLEKPGVIDSSSDIGKGLNGIQYPLLLQKTFELEKLYYEQVESHGCDTSSAHRELFSRLLLNCLARSKEIADRCSFTKLLDILAKLVDSWGSHSWQNATEELLSLDNRQSDKKAMSLYKKMRTGVQIVPPKQLLISLMVRLKTHHHNYSMRLFKDYKLLHFEDPGRGAKIMIDALAFRGDLDMVLKLITQLLRETPGSIEPLYMESLITAYMRRADIDNVVKLFESLQSDFNFEPTLKCWHMVIKAFSRVGDVDSAIEYYERLCESDIKPTSTTYELMLGVHARRGDLNPIQKILAQIRRQDLEVTMPMFDYLVMAYVKRDDILAAEKLCRQFLTSKVKGSRLRMWNYVLLQSALKWRFQRVNRVFLEMQTYKIGCDDRTIGALMLCLCNENRPEQAHKLVNKVMPRLNIEPTTLHWAILMRGYLRVKKARNAFMIYRTMLKKRVRPDFNTKILLMKAASMSDVQSLPRNQFANATFRTPLTLPTAEAMLQALVDDLSPTDISLSHPIVGIGPSQRLNEAAVSSAYQFLTYLYGVKGNSERVSALFNQYEETSKRFYPDRASIPSVRMIASLMVDYRKTRYTRGMEQLWKLACQQAWSLSHKLGATYNQTGAHSWVLPQYRQILDLCLSQHILFLRDSHREAEIYPVLRNLREDGYWINSHNLNLYVQALAGSRQRRFQIEAFAECEHRLMPGWQGWYSTTSTKIPPPKLVRYKVKRQQPGFDSVNLHSAAPMYRTLVMMARLWMDLRAQHQFQQVMGGTFMQKLGKSAPMTVEAIQAMPKMPHDKVQARYLSEDM